MARFFITRPIFSGVISIVIMIAGLVASLSLPVAQYPEISPPTVIVSEGGVGRPIDEIVLNAALFEREGVHVAGAIVNKVDLLAKPDLARTLTTERPDTRVAFMSGYTRDEVDRRGFPEPGVLLIHKPFTVHELAVAVREALDTRQAPVD